ncbi:transposase [Nocardia sp. CA-128927]|uniref:transposase n=1 Tax=Nocardia sp. CA-128927 TaxID=3239975 RepID=UPI003D989081
MRDRGIAVRIARKGIESSQKLGKHRWVIERSIAWLFGYRRLNIRYERYAHHFCAFLTLAATLTCYKKLAKAKSAARSAACVSRRSAIPDARY